ncbi:MAG: hypothetical protein AVDCRST_MAG05-38 [uncultured Rubrobacteraceae bacterium]|uniref:Uncharacterized protein n=1 Tax=uncultured Rubrobacteraceae bacterium TaxID=349277 RepID=A0A6J4RD73_9ACTN|nr:MAG: hypothetical protein AVDCRST_MAG05-38 [uncultured Rubrobacteraceae bacterium]
MAFGRVLVVFLEETRTFRRPRPDDLREVRRLALSEMERFLYAAGSPPGKYSLYADRLVAICLAQGAAQHLVDLDAASAHDNEVRVDETGVRDKGLRVLPDGRVLSGVKDLDVVFFSGRTTGCRSRLTGTSARAWWRICRPWGVAGSTL